MYLQPKRTCNNNVLYRIGLVMKIFSTIKSINYKKINKENKELNENKK